MDFRNHFYYDFREGFDIFLFNFTTILLLTSANEIPGLYGLPSDVAE